MSNQMAGKTKPPCEAPGCDRESFVKGLCYAHYRRKQRGGDISTPINTYGELVQLTGTRVRPEVAATFKAVAAAQDISEYDLLARIVEDWCEKVAPAKKKLK